MKKILFIIVVAIGAWFAYQQLEQAEVKKPDNSAVKYAEGLKSSEEKAEAAKAAADLAVIRSAIISFKSSQGRYPDSLQELATKGYVDRIPAEIQYDRETGEVK